MESGINYKKMGEKIRKARIRRHMTQEKLAELCLLSCAHIGHIERGTRIPSLETVFRISQALEVSVDHLLSGSFSNENNTIYYLDDMLREADENKRTIIMTTVKALLDYTDDQTKMI